MLQQSVGKQKANKPVDVAIIQLLLNDTGLSTVSSPTAGPGKNDNIVIHKGAGNSVYVPLPPLKVDGKSSPELIRRIETYQKAKNFKVIDGCIGEGGNDLRCLLADAGGVNGNARMAYLRLKLGVSLNFSALKIDPFIELYQKQYTVLSAQNKAGLRSILTTAKSDSNVSSLTELAYMLATTKHETANTFRPIEEYGKGAGRTYGTEIKVIDPKTKKEYKNVYYGRGYVQLTWGYNYQKVDQQLGNGNYPNKNKGKASEFNTGFTISNSADSIYLHPEHALKESVAYTSLTWGMQNGIYTTRKIGDYITNVKTDYVNARRVINGTDRASQIATYAENFEMLLRLGCL